MVRHLVINTSNTEVMPLSSFGWYELLFPTGVTRDIALRLFRSSLFAVDNFLIKESTYFADIVTAQLYKILPLSWQNAFREAGGISVLSDIGVLVLGATLGLSNVQILLDMFHVSRKITRFQYGSTPLHRIEVFRPVNSVINRTQLTGCGHSSLTKRAKTIVFVHGGAWGSGQLWQYRLVANGLGNIMGATSVVLVGYPTYPIATILEQRDCVTEALRFIGQNDSVQRLLTVNRSTPDKDDIHYSSQNVYVSYSDASDALVLCGHSSGANICALSLLDTGVTTPTSSSTSKSSLRPLVDVFVGLSGPYDIVKHYLFEERRGVHVVSPMTAAAGGKEGLPHCSPTLLAELLLTEQSEATKTAVSMPHMVLLHGQKDNTVPFRSSTDFADALSKLGVSHSLLLTKVSILHRVDLQELKQCSSSLTTVTSSLLLTVFVLSHMYSLCAGRPRRASIGGTRGVPHTTQRNRRCAQACFAAPERVSSIVGQKMCVVQNM